MLYDNHGRVINYIRLAVTDRCNLRCTYCMPEEGIKYVAQKALLSYEELERLLGILGGMGIRKVRITGGEPFVRKDMPRFMERITQIKGIEQLHLTTNGTVGDHLAPFLKKIGVKSVNLSLDSLDPKRFYAITRRDVFPKVMDTFHALIQEGIPTKINMVVMANSNIEDIIPMVELTRKYPVSVRFIEEMPFNGAGGKTSGVEWNYRKILQHLQAQYPDLQKIPDPPNATAMHYKIPNFQGNFGIIAAYSRTFCGSCNRIRLTPQGVLKTCLYDDGVFNLKDLIRAGASDAQIKATLLEALGNRAKDGHEAEKKRHFGISESMSTIGG